ncbi:hypothetical protein [Providencia manganoxydans]|uniref:hypothetical protein n=1 Tax=Providencia manganoxydans TaxID=2923283 RepID=UPI0032DA5B8E
MRKTGFDLPTETMANMFIKGMAIKDDERVFRLDGEQLRVIESELVIKERIQAVKVKKEANSHKNIEYNSKAIERIKKLIQNR